MSGLQIIVRTCLFPIPRAKLRDMCTVQKETEIFTETVYLPFCFLCTCQKCVVDALAKVSERHLTAPRYPLRSKKSSAAKKEPMFYLQAIQKLTLYIDTASP